MFCLHGLQQRILLTKIAVYSTSCVGWNGINRQQCSLAVSSMAECGCGECFCLAHDGRMRGKNSVARSISGGQAVISEYTRYEGTITDERHR